MYLLFSDKSICAVKNIGWDDHHSSHITQSQAPQSQQERDRNMAENKQQALVLRDQELRLPVGV
jgi:hypothetical protein